MVQNDETEEDNDEIADDIDQTNADYYDRSPVAASTSENNDINPVAKNFDTASDSDESVTEDNNTISSDDESLDDDDYGYYNSKDKKTMDRRRITVCNFFFHVHFFIFKGFE